MSDFKNVESDVDYKDRRERSIVYEYAKLEALLEH